MKAHYSKARVGIVAIVFAMVFAVFVARLVFVQVVKGAEYGKKARRQYMQSIEIPAPRGQIFDAKGRKVVGNDCFQSLFAYPLTRGDVEKSYAELSRILNKNERTIRKEFTLRPKTFRWIKRGLTDQESRRFRSSKGKCGLFVREEPTRCYPFGTIGRSVLGFVNLDNRGESGVELVMNDYLTGSKGRSVIQRDGMGTRYHIKEVPVKKSQPGESVVLTIDWDKQQVVEEELARAVEKYHAKGGMAIFIDPNSGAILAAADYAPQSSPNNKPVKLDAVANTYEPGSIFKLITAAAALESGRIHPGDSFNAEHGRWRLGRHILRDDHKYDTLSFRSAFELSSNIVMGKIANEVGGDNVLAMARKLGFGQKTRCGLNGESKGVLKRPPRWSTYVTSTFAIGHGLSVTPLQMARAFAAVASGGYLYQPYIVKGCINSKGQIVERHESHPVKVLDADVVKQLDSFMRGVVSRGTAKLIAKTPFAIAGKTGTAEKPNFETGGYHKNKFMASFAGYFPADSPLVAGIVVLDEPEPVHYGGYTSGPTFKNIAVKFAALDNYEMSSPVYASQTNQKIYETKAIPQSDKVRLPDFSGQSKGKVIKELKKLGLTVTFEGSGSKVLATYPDYGAFVDAGQSVRCYLGDDNVVTRRIPNVSGLTVREAIALLDAYGICADIQGKGGRIINQTPSPGEILREDRRITIVCKRNKGA